MPGKNDVVQLNNEDLEKVVGGTDVKDCIFDGELKYQITLGHAYIRNHYAACVYVPTAFVSGPRGYDVVNGGDSFYTFTCTCCASNGNYQRTDNIKFGKNDSIDEISNFVIVNPQS